MSKQLQVITITLIILAVIAVGTVAYFKFSSEDTWLCQNGQWVKHGNPRLSMPTVGCDAMSNYNKNDNNNINANLNANNTNAVPEEINVKVDGLNAGDTVTNPLIVTGTARTWYFEGSFPIKLLDETGKVLAAVPAEAQGEWMTSDWVPFKATLNFISPKNQNGTLVLAEDNPAGFDEFEKLEIPVKILKTETLTLKVFFGNELKNPNAMDCTLVYPLERIIAKTVTTAKASLEELLKGPTETELTQKYYTSINTGVSLNKVTITNGTAYADFNSQLEYQVGGSCRVAAIASQIRETLKQFPTVKDVVISIDGRTEDILQP